MEELSMENSCHASQSNQLEEERTETLVGKPASRRGPWSTDRSPPGRRRRNRTWKSRGGSFSVVCRFVVVVVVVVVVGSLLCSGSKKNTMQLLEYGNCSRWCLSLSLSLLFWMPMIMKRYPSSDYTALSQDSGGVPRWLTRIRARNIPIQ